MVTLVSATTVHFVFSHLHDYAAAAAAAAETTGYWIADGGIVEAHRCSETQ